MTSASKRFPSVNASIDGNDGSLLSTPILNLPQTAILSMHKIEDRPVVVDGEVVVRPFAPRQQTLEDEWCTLHAWLLKRVASPVSWSEYRSLHVNRCVLFSVCQFSLAI